MILNRKTPPKNSFKIYLKIKKIFATQSKAKAETKAEKARVSCPTRFRNGTR